jgi:hypothetical protein
MKLSKIANFTLALIITFAQLTWAQDPNYQGVSYNAGPDVTTPEGREVLDIMAEAGSYGDLSVLIAGEQRFRPLYGPTFSRMLFEKNSIVALVQGQDVTHKAEFAGNPATAGFGGRAEDVGRYIGVRGEMGFINSYAATITGQYGSSGSPIVQLDSQGRPEKLTTTTIIDNGFWTLSMDARSRVTQTRHKLLTWILKNNPESLRLVILFGGASRDAFANFLASNGAQVGTNFDPKKLSRTRVPKMKLVNTGGNGQAAVPLTKEGGDLYELVLGRKLNYKLPQKKPKGFVADIDQAREKLSAELDRWFDQMAFLSGGLDGSGLLHPAQIGGFDLDSQLVIQGQPTISLKGLKLTNGYTVQNDILVQDFPHPTRMSMEGKEWASKEINKSMAPIRWFIENRGFVLNPKPHEKSDFEKAMDYEYARSDTDSKTYNFGTPQNRMGSTSDAVRAGAHIIIDGSRDKKSFLKQTPKQKAAGEIPEFDMSVQLAANAKELPAQMPPANELWTTAPQGTDIRYQFDRGPSIDIDQIIGESVPGVIAEVQPTTGAFAHYRGKWKGARGLYLYTPFEEYSDILTQRAATGDFGQHFHGLMEQRGVGDQYLVLKTVPASKESWALNDWKKMFDASQEYRKRLIQAVLSKNDLEFIIVDDPIMESELNTLLKKSSKIPVIRMNRVEGVVSSGFEELAARLAQVPTLNQTPYQVKRSNIPRSHLYFTSRWWEGTSGDRVLTALDPELRGKVFASVVPTWASRQKFQMPADQLKAAKDLRQWVEDMALKVTPITDCNLLFLDRKTQQAAQPWIPKKEAS